MPYTPTQHPFVEVPELESGFGTRRVVIAGGGPVGMAMALDLAHRGVPSVVLERGSSVGVGSKAICWAKRTLEIFDRLGVGQRIMNKGVVWNVGKVFYGDSDEPLYQFDLLPEDGHQFPAFVNLQQYYVEEYLVAALTAEPLVELRWQSEVVEVKPGAERVAVKVRTPAGDYTLSCEYLIAADGSHSPVRRMLGLEFAGKVFQDHFLIADIKLHGEFPAERWFWFDPPFNRGRTALLHKQPDDVWRTDFQLGWNIDRDEELKEDNVTRRVRGLIGDQDFDFEWVSIYTFECRRLERFVHGRVIFIGDAAHLVSPFGARGCNGGIQDVDNLGWKLALILEGNAGPGLLASYDRERTAAADENILNSSRATDFMTPKNNVSRAFRSAVLDLARDYPFARAMVNSGRLSVPAVLADSPLNAGDESGFEGGLGPGTPCVDAPIQFHGRDEWLLEHLNDGFAALVFAEAAADLPRGLDRLAVGPIPIRTLIATGNPAPLGAAGSHPIVVDRLGYLRERYDLKPGTCYLIRPDQHVAGRWRRFEHGDVQQALAVATGELV